MPTLKDLKGEKGDAKILIMGPPKGGKTWCIMETAPKPIFVFNADPGGLKGPANAGFEAEYENVFNSTMLDKARAYVTAEMKTKDPFRTLVVDSLTLLGQHLEAELKRKGLEGWDVWREFGDIVGGFMSWLMSQPAHVILTAHAAMEGAGGGDMGHVPIFPGKYKALIPAIVNDWLWLEVTPGREKDNAKTQREFLLNAQGAWKHGCRSLSFVGKIPADVGAFIKMTDKEKKK